MFCSLVTVAHSRSWASVVDVISLIESFSVSWWLAHRNGSGQGIKDQRGSRKELEGPWVHTNMWRPQGMEEELEEELLNASRNKTRKKSRETRMELRKDSEAHLHLSLVLPLGLPSTKYFCLLVANEWMWARR